MDTSYIAALQPVQQALFLTITRTIATIRDKVTMLKTINDQLQPVFGFDSTGIFIVNEAENYHYDLTTQNPNIDDSAGNHQLHQQWAIDPIPHLGSAIAACYDQLRASQLPILFDFVELFSQYPHPFADVILSLGYQEAMGGLLRVGGKPLGILFFNSLTKGFFSEVDFPLFQAITDQIAVAVDNILANEEIREREREKTALLAISEAIATIRYKKDLLEVIIDKIKPVFNFYDCGLFVFDAEKRHLEDLTVSLPSISPSETNQLLAESDSAFLPFRDRCLSHFLNAYERLVNL